MTATEIRCFEHARRAAEMSNFGRVRVGCVIAEHGKVLSAGFNSTRTHPLQLHYNRYRTFRDGTTSLPAQLHAETAATLPLRNLDIDWGKLDVFVYRVRKDQPHGLAAPCPACRQYLIDLGVRSIYYTTGDGYAHEAIERKELE